MRFVHLSGRDYASSQYNRAFQARRQPDRRSNCLFISRHFENGMHPQHQLIDGPLKIGKWQPRNYGGGYDGAVTLKDAMAQSINTVAVQVSERIGRQKVIDTARRLGITSPLRSHPSLALGAMRYRLSN